MILKNVNLLLIMALFLNCSSRNDMSEYIDGDDLVPPAPSFIYYFTIHGADVDQDGVRDDFELFVNKRFKDPNVRRSLKYDAKLFGEYMRATSSNEINRIFNERIDSEICSSALYYSEINITGREASELRGRLYNNFWRKMHFNSQGRKVASGTYSYGGTSVMSKLHRCKIKFTNLRNTLLIYLRTNYKYGMTPEEIKEFENILGISSVEN